MTHGKCRWVQVVSFWRSGVVEPVETIRRDHGDRQKETTVWDTKTGQLLLTLGGHEGAVFCVAFSPDGNTIATAGGDGTIRLWGALTGSEMRT